MKQFFRSALAVLLVCSPFVASSQGGVQPASFKPLKLVGEWKFQNRETGVKYGGAIAIDLLNVLANGSIKSLVSYDGRQTNDKCSTRGLIADTPVDAEVVKTPLGYQVTFQLKCSIGESPRPFTWNLSCASDGVCSEPTTRPWGTGAIAVSETK